MATKNRKTNNIRIEHVYSTALTLDMAKVPRLPLNAADAATRAELARMVEGKPELTSLSEIDLETLSRRYRMQRIIFEATRDTFEQMQPDWKGSKEHLLGQVFRLVEQFLRSDRIEIVPPLFNENELRRRIMLTLNMSRIVRHLWDAIRRENTERIEPVFDSQRPILSTGDPADVAGILAKHNG